MRYRSFIRLLPGLLLILVLAGCRYDNKIPDSIPMNSPAADFRPEVEITDAYCRESGVPANHMFELHFTLRNLTHEKMVIGYYWSLNDPRADGLGYARNSNDPGARMYQGQIKNTTLPSSSEASPTVVEVNVRETRVYDPSFYVMYISVYRGDTQIGFYREQKSAFDWDYSATPPVRKKIVPVTAAPISETTRISREQAIETASNTLPDSIVKRADISAEIHGWYWEVIFDKLNAEAAELMPWPLKGPPPLPPGQPTLEPYAGIWQSIIITLDAQTGELKSGGARQAPQHGPYLKREEAVKNATETITPDAAIWGVETDWFENAHMEAYLRGDTWIVLFWEEGSKENRFSVTVNAVTGFVSGAGRG